MRGLLISLVICLSATATHAAPQPVYNDYTLVGPVVPGEEIFFQLWLATAKNPRVLIHSPGGNMITSMLIMDMIKAHGKVRCEVRGIASSGAFGILQACKTRYMSIFGRLLTHAPRIAVDGVLDEPAAESLTADLKEKTKMWNAAMCSRLKMTVDEYTKKVRGQDYTMDVKEALLVGAVDGIIP